jgi:hypothetical protein
LSTPLSLEMVPWPSFKPPRQTADALRFMFALCVRPSVNSLRLVKGYQRFSPTSSGTMALRNEARLRDSRQPRQGVEALIPKGAVQPQRTQRTQRGRFLRLPPLGKKTGGAPASGTAALLRSHAKAPCRRPAFRWYCQDAPTQRETGVSITECAPLTSGRALSLKVFSLRSLRSTGSFSSAIEGCSTEKSVEKLRTAGSCAAKSAFTETCSPLHSALSATSGQAGVCV